MALLSRFVRDARFLEIDGCPLAAKGAVDDEGACARCPYNALMPGKARVGCVASTSAASVKSALSRLERIDERSHARLRVILEEEQQQPEQSGLSPADLSEVGTIAKKWSSVCGNDADERQVVAILLGFSERAAATGEKVRVLG